MTLAAAPSKIIYAGDGVTTAFGFAFTIFTGDGSDIEVTVFDNASPRNEYPLTGNFTVDIPNSRVLYPTVGGVSPLAPAVTALPVGWEIVLNRVEALDQAVVLTDEGVISLAALESELDYLTAICQQLQEQINRATLVPVNTPGPAQAITAPAVSPVGLVQVNGTWAQLVTYAQAAPTIQFLGFVTSGDQAGSQFFYSANVNLGNQGFIAIGGA